MKTARAVGSFLCCVAVAAAIGVPAARAQRRAPSELAARSMAQQKIDSRLMYEISRRRPDARSRDTSRRATGVKVDRHGRAYVDVRASVSAPLQKKIAALGGRISATDPTYDTIVGWVPLLTLERLAADATVRGISPVVDTK